jgi:hypothetical protein
MDLLLSGNSNAPGGPAEQTEHFYMRVCVFQKIIVIFVTKFSEHK